jgi:hypothetical protein
VKYRGWPPRFRGGLAPRLAALSCGFLVIALSAAPAGASLARDVERLAFVWAGQSRVERLRPRVLGRGERLPLALPLWATTSSGLDCISLAVLSSPSSNFVVHSPGPAEGEPEASRIGWVQLTRCGKRRAELQRTLIEMRSPRGIVELLVARSASPLPTPGKTLAHRDPGPASPSVAVGDAPMLPPVERRAAWWQAQAQRDGAEKIEHQLLGVDNERVPKAELELGAGCHRLSALAVGSPARQPARDLDLFVRGVAGSELARQDQSENSDAQLELCVGSPSVVEALVLGLMPSEVALLQHAQFPLPVGLTERWGADARARFAQAFFRRRFRGPRTTPIHEALGLAGRSILPLQLEVQTCYVAAVAVIQGAPKALLLDVTLADRDGSVDTTSSEPAIALGFCSGNDGLARVRVEAMGPSLAWLLAVWRVPRQERMGGS